MSLIVALGGFEGLLFTQLHLYAAPLDIVVGLPIRGNEKELNATFKSGSMRDPGCGLPRTPLLGRS